MLFLLKIKPTKLAFLRFIVRMTLFLLHSVQYFLHFSHGTRWRSWLWHCATSRKVASLFPYDVTQIFH
jgi:hypothetical protein